MTIEIVRYYKHAAPQTMHAVAKAVEEEMRPFREYARQAAEKEGRLNVKAIERWAKKHSATIVEHQKSWIFTALSGEKVEMPPGHFTWKDGVLQQIIVKRVGR